MKQPKRLSRKNAPRTAIQTGQVVYHKCIIPRKGQNMEEKKKTITITREEFKERLAKASAEIVSDAMEADVDIGIPVLLLSAIIGGNLEIALFEEEKENGN